MTHTQGPWIARENPAQDGKHSHWIDSDQPLAFPLAEVRWYKDGESDANARLIAAAPELLAACQHALEDLQTLDAADSKVCGILPELRAAIAKATGDQT